MSDRCCGPATCTTADTSPVFRRVLWWALAINVVMVGAEIIAGWLSASMSLQADALDFLGDAGNYAISLAVLGLGLRARAGAALVKGATMGLFGLWVAGNTLYRVWSGMLPDAIVMGAVGLLALFANLAVAAMLYRFREGDSNRESVWICSRNDAIANVAVLLASAAVSITGTRWPDLVVAAVIAGLAVTGAWRVLRSAMRELRAGEASLAQ